jgi:hypothetical protein
MDKAFVGHFATLSDFFGGTESLIGVPNPNIQLGAEQEHCKRPNAWVEFFANNYNLWTRPIQEWFFVVSPKKSYNEKGDKFDYPHTPSDKALWKPGNQWTGEVGRDEKELAEFLKLAKVTEAGLVETEVVGLRLYSGPMFVLYNAVLRGFPAEHMKWLRGVDGSATNRYETTIFMIVSAITKLSKISAVPKGRTVYRGLGGMLLPDQFWEEFAECQVSFLVRTSSAEAAEALRTALAARVQAGSAQQKKDLLSFLLLDEQTLLLPGDAAPAGVRVAREASAEGFGVRMAVALRLAKREFTEEVRGRFCAAVAAVCSVKAEEVAIEDVADKPRDFKGGGLRPPHTPPTIPTPTQSIQLSLVEADSSSQGLT